MELDEVKVQEEASDTKTSTTDMSSADDENRLMTSADGNLTLPVKQEDGKPDISIVIWQRYG